MSIFRKVMVLLGLSIYAVFSSPVFAGAVDGGGGNARVCFSEIGVADKIRANNRIIADEFIPKIKSVELLDVYEAKLPRGFPPKAREIIAANQLTVGEYFEKIRKRVDDAAHVLNHFDLPSDIYYYDNPIKTISDITQFAELENEYCVISTMAAQDREAYAIHIDNRLFSHPSHSVESRAALFIHEAYYFYAARMGAKTSDTTRQMVGIFLTKEKGFLLRDLIGSAMRNGFIKNSEEYFFRYAFKQTTIGSLLMRLLDYDVGSYYSNIKDVLSGTQIVGYPTPNAREFKNTFKTIVTKTRCEPSFIRDLSDLERCASESPLLLKKFKEFKTLVHDEFTVLHGTSNQGFDNAREQIKKNPYSGSAEEKSKLLNAVDALQKEVLISGFGFQGFLNEPFFKTCGGYGPSEHKPIEDFFCYDSYGKLIIWDKILHYHIADALGKAGATFPLDVQF